METSQLLKGVLDLAVLAVLRHEDGYGYDVVRRLRKAGLDDVGDASVYGTLRRLYKAGLLTTYVVASEEGPHRKYYDSTSWVARGSSNRRRHGEVLRPRWSACWERTMTAHTHPVVRAYLARVRTALSDLPAAEIDEIVDDVRPHLAELAESLGDRASVAAMIEEFGTPRATRPRSGAAGEYPPPPSVNTGEGDRKVGPAPGARMSLWGLVLGAFGAMVMGIVIGSSRNDEALVPLLVVAVLAAAAAAYVWINGPGVVRSLPEVRWFVAGSGGVWSPAADTTALGGAQPGVVVAVRGVADFAGHRPGGRGYNGVLGLPVLLAVAALALWAGPKSRTDRRMLWAAVPVSAFVVGAGLGLAGHLIGLAHGHSGDFHAYEATNTTIDGELLLLYGQEEVENLYLFDSEGTPLTDVYIYTDDGRPLLAQRYGCEQHTQEKIPVGRDNHFPRPHIEQGGVDEFGTVNGYNAYRAFCREVDEVPFTVAVPVE